MSLVNTIENVVKGLGSVLFRAGTLNGILSSAVSDGIENGITRAMPVLLKNVVVGAVLLTGTFLIGLGSAKWIEPMFATPGLGFVITGIFLVAIGIIYVNANK